MKNENQKLILFVLLALALTTGFRLILSATGFLPAPPVRPKVVPAVVQAPAGNAVEPAPAPVVPKAAAGEAAKTAEQPAPGVEKPQQVALVDPGELLLGSAGDKSAAGYRLAVQLDQKGAGVTSVASSRYEADFLGKNPHLPLFLIEPDPSVPPSFVTNLASLSTPGQAQAANAGAVLAAPAGFNLDFAVWEVVRDAEGRTVQPIAKEDARIASNVSGQQVTFRTTVGDPAVVVTKTYRLWQNEDGFELELGFESPSADRTIVYQVMGPHGIPIEGESFTDTFRDVFFGQKGLEIKTRTAADVVKAQANPNPLSASPLLFAGVENPYFAVFLEPEPLPTGDNDSPIHETVPTVIRENREAPLKSDVSVQVTSNELNVGPNRPAKQVFRIFAGPKRVSALAPYAAQQLAVYRKTGWFFIPFASTMAQSVISPLLDRIYAFTQFVARRFGGKTGNYGIAIILLTITVRLMLFPLSRKQAISAKKMQDLQPHMVELKEKHKDDKERLTKETFALYKKQGVNPMGGCVPALIQLPIFVGLWQALKNSVELRHASFLWIKNLAAPDMLFHFPFPIPLLGSFLGDYFNLLPFLVVSLMLVQTKLFSPPPTTPEAEMQMKTMKFMMIFMAFMFYRVPSGLGIYFITSSLWAIGERLLLPKMAAAHARKPEGDRTDEGLSGGGGGKGGGGSDDKGGGGPSDGKGGNGMGPTGWWAQHKDRLEKLIEDASKDRTVRNEPAKHGPDRERPRARPGKRR